MQIGQVVEVGYREPPGQWVPRELPVEPERIPSRREEEEVERIVEPVA